MKKLASILLALLMMTCCVLASAETFTGEDNGIGAITVTLTVEDGKITAAEVTGENETKGFGYEPIYEGKYAEAIVAAQGAGIDAIAGVTVTTEAVIRATEKAMVAAGLKAAEEKAAATDAECDIVIIGAGGAGMSAALQAVDCGVENVIVLEKTGSTGGNTSRATGGMNAAKTAAQDKNEWKDATAAAVEKTIASAKENYPQLSELIATVEAQFNEYKANPVGYFDSVELYALDTMVGGKAINNLDLVMTMVNGSADAIDWLATKNADLVSVGSFGGASVMRIHRALTAEGKTTPVGAYLVKTLTAGLEAEEKIDLRMNNEATELVVTDGKVTGVKVTSPEGDYTITAKAVILATGGFGADLERVAAYQPSLDGFVTTNAPGVTGDGIDMAVAIGAATVDMEQIQIHPSVYTETSALITEGIRGDGAILVNQKGERFIDELGTRDVVSAAELAQEGGYAYTIVKNCYVTDTVVFGNNSTSAYCGGIVGFQQPTSTSFFSFTGCAVLANVPTGNGFAGVEPTSGTLSISNSFTANNKWYPKSAALSDSYLVSDLASVYGSAAKDTMPALAWNYIWAVNEDGYPTYYSRDYNPYRLAQVISHNQG